MSAFDPKRTSVHQICCDAQTPLALTVVGLWGKGISVSRIVGSYFSVRSILSSTNKLELGYRMTDVKKFPRARSWGLCSGIEQIWEEHVLDGEATLR